MTQNEANLIVTLFYIQNKGKKISDIIGYSSKNYGHYIDKLETTSTGIYVLSEDGYCIVYGGIDMEYIYSPLYQELSHNRVLNYISFEDLI